MKLCCLPSRLVPSKSLSNCAPNSMAAAGLRGTIMTSTTALRLQPVRGWPAVRPQLLRVVHSGATNGSGASVATGGRSEQSAPAKPTWEIRMLYDGECPLCMREVDMLKRRDAGFGKIDFVDVASPEYKAEDNYGVGYEQAMERIHAVLPDGTVVTDVEVFRRLYDAVGLGWVYAATKYEPVMKAANWVYGIWAKYRLPITGRPDMSVVLQEKKMCKAGSDMKQ